MIKISRADSWLSPDRISGVVAEKNGRSPASVPEGRIHRLCALLAVYGSVIFGIAVQIDRAKRLGWMAHRKEKPALDAFLTRHLLADAIPNANADRESDQ